MKTLIISFSLFIGTSLFGMEVKDTQQIVADKFGDLSSDSLGEVRGETPDISESKLNEESTLVRYTEATESNGPEKVALTDIRLRK